MKKNRKEKEVKLEINESNKKLMYFQLFLMLITFVILVIYFFNRKAILYLMLSLSFTLITMAFTNLKIYKNKVNYYLFLSLGIILSVLLILMCLGV